MSLLHYPSSPTGRTFDVGRKHEGWKRTILDSHNFRGPDLTLGRIRLSLRPKAKVSLFLMLPPWF
jgi:hypothetical protein